MSESTQAAPESPDFFAVPTKGEGTKRINWKPKAIGVFFLALVVGGVAYTFYDRMQEFERAAEEEIKIVKVATPPVKKPDGPDVNYPVGAPAAPGQMYPAGNGAMPMIDEAAKQAAAKKAAELDAAMKASTVIAWQKQENKQPSERVEPRVDESVSPYLKHTRMPALSPYELKAGSNIPGVMVEGTNSDLPGQLRGQVRENVYDSVSGSHLLIPAGCVVVGSYDSNVAVGQERILVAWHRIIFPDGSSISLDGMPGVDQRGLSGFKEKVDNHYWRTFGNAAMLSIFSSGIRLSQQGVGTDPQQIMGAAAGQQLGQSGMQMARGNLNIQPTLETSPGFKFSIKVTRDIILPPWGLH